MLKNPLDRIGLNFMSTTNFGIAKTNISISLYWREERARVVLSHGLVYHDALNFTTVT